MNIRDNINSMFTENPVPPTKQLDMFDYGQNGYETAILTPEAPEELKKLVGDDGEVILVSVNPYKIKLKNSDQIFVVKSKDIVIENKIKKEIKQYTKEYLKYLGVSKGE